MVPKGRYLVVTVVINTILVINICHRHHRRHHHHEQRKHQAPSAWSNLLYICVLLQGFLHLHSHRTTRCRSLYSTKEPVRCTSTRNRWKEQCRGSLLLRLLTWVQPSLKQSGTISNRPQQKPNRTDPDRAEPSRTEPNRAGPNCTKQKTTEQNRTGNSRTEPNRTDPNRPEPKRTAAWRAYGI